jgi:hypothetical protein
MADPAGGASSHGTPPVLKRLLARAERIPGKLKQPSLPAAGTLFTAPAGYKSAGIMIAENFQLVLNTVPRWVEEKADVGSPDVIVQLKAETIWGEDKRMVKDKIEVEYFIKEFLCC